MWEAEKKTEQTKKKMWEYRTNGIDIVIYSRDLFVVVRLIGILTRRFCRKSETFFPVIGQISLAVVVINCFTKHFVNVIYTNWTVMLHGERMEYGK